jgi:prefoldin alpha subunit
MAEHVHSKVEEELQRGVLQLRFLENQLAQVQQQIAAVDAAVIEVSVTKGTIDTIKDLKSDSPSLVPIGAGVFANGILKKSSTVLMDVGAGVVMEKELVAAVELLDKREKELRGSVENFQRYLNSLERQYADLSYKMQELSKR